MKNALRFDETFAPSLSARLHSGLRAYAINAPAIGPPTTLWMQLRDGQILRVGVNMHDLSGWEEIGTLTFEVVPAEAAPEMTSLTSSWLELKEVQKLVYVSDECEAECGLFLSTVGGDSFVVVPGADVYTLAIKAPFIEQAFMPENDLAAYVHREF